MCQCGRERSVDQDRALLVAPGEGTPRMSTAAGDAIWPDRDAATLAALTRVAELFGASVVEARPSATGNSVTPRKGTVMSIDAETADVAALYAHLTNRRFEAALNAALL